MVDSAHLVVVVANNGKFVVVQGNVLRG